ncbi:MAG: TIGR00266 family protein [Lachnospiraceae bacterium]|nr:TIGR00266 family protein [Lachnospiraceae bacterium]
MRYKIEGEPFPVVHCELEEGEEMISENGAMCWMSPNMKLEAKSNGGAGKAVGHVFAVEALFLDRYTAVGGKGKVSFASRFPGCVRVFEIAPGKELIAQKSAFLASTSGVELSVYLHKKVGTALFGGEGITMQRLPGQGTLFVGVDGYINEYELAAGEQIVISTGHLAAMSATCKIDIQAVKGVKNKFLSGEGLFYTTVTGPGHVWVQTLPIARMARAISKYLPHTDKS